MQPLRPASDFAAIPWTLARHGVDFVVVGGIAATLQGAPINTYDLYVVHSRIAENVTRRLGALTELEAIYRIQIAVKEEVNRDKDRATLPILRQTGRERGGL